MGEAIVRATLASALLALAGAARAGPIIILPQDITHEHGPACYGIHWGPREAGQAMARATPALSGLTNPNGTMRQLVWADFDGPATFTVALRRLDGTTGTYVAPNGCSLFDTYVYSPAERADIVAAMQAHYAGFNVEFTTTRPSAGEYTHL